MLYLSFAQFAAADTRDEAISHNLDGVRKLNAGDTKGAFEEFTKTLQIRPDYTNAYTNRIVAADKLGDYETVIGDYKKLRRTHLRYKELVSPDIIADNFFKLGMAQQKSKNDSSAIDSFTEAIKLKPDEPEYYLVRARSKLSAKDLKGANEDLQACKDRADKLEKRELENCAGYFDRSPPNQVEGDFGSREFRFVPGEGLVRDPI